MIALFVVFFCVRHGGTRFAESVAPVVAEENAN